jgi:hypothetical protein
MNLRLNVGHVCKQAASEIRGGVKASSLPVVALCYVRLLVRLLLKRGKKAFLSADSRLSRENYKVFKIDHYDIVKSFEERATLLRSEAICRPYTKLGTINLRE